MAAFLYICIMKNTLLLTLIFLATCAAAQTTLTGGQLLSRGIYLGDQAVTISCTASMGAIDCKPFESFSNWEAKEDGVKTCEHSWVYAEYGDVNRETGITTLQYCPCGCTDHENQARICSKCLRHESRVRTYGYNQVPKPVSEYKRLSGKTKQ